MIRQFAAAAAAISVLGLTSPLSAQEQSKPVKLMTVTTKSVALDRVFYGKVAAKHSVDLAFQVGGQIVEFPVIEGDRIAKGSIIAKLDSSNFALAFEQASLQKEQADRTLERFTKLSGQTVSQVTIDDANTQARIADVAFRKAQKDLDDTTLIAPFDALVATRNVESYVTIGAGNPVVRLHDMSELSIEIDVPEVLFQRAGSRGNVTLSAQFPANDKTYPLEVREFNAEASKAGQTYRLTLGMETPEDLSILPGSSVSVRARATTEKQQIIIPATALVYAPDQTLSVMVFQAGDTENFGVVKSVAVEIQATENGNFAVLTGLEDGQEVVAAGASKLTDGEAVRRFTGFAN